MLRVLLLHCFRSHECRLARALGIWERWALGIRERGVLSMLCFEQWVEAGMMHDAAVAAAVAGIVVGTAVAVETGVDGGSLVVDVGVAAGVGRMAEERMPDSNAAPVASAGTNPGTAVAAIHNYCCWCRSLGMCRCTQNRQWIHGPSILGSRTHVVAVAVVAAVEVEVGGLEWM